MGKVVPPTLDVRRDLTSIAFGSVPGPGMRSPIRSPKCRTRGSQSRDQVYHREVKAVSVYFNELRKPELAPHIDRQHSPDSIS